MPEETADARTEEAVAGPSPDPAAQATAQPVTEPTVEPTGSATGPTAGSAAEPPAEAAAGETAAATDGAVPFPLPARLVFRTPASAYVAIAFLAMCVSFVAVAAPYLTVVYLLPLGALVRVWRTRTEVDADRLVVRRVLTRTVLPWSRVASLRLVDKGWVRAVRTDGGEIPLPSVRTRHLPALALISGGRLPDPTGPATGS